MLLKEEQKRITKKQESPVSKEGKCKEKMTWESPRSQSAINNQIKWQEHTQIFKKNTKIASLLLLVFTWKNTLKSNKSTENSTGGSWRLAA